MPYVQSQVVRDADAHIFETRVSGGDRRSG
jgi:hypothetical protein